LIQKLNQGGDCGFKPGDYPAISAIHHSENIVWPEYPPTPQAWAEAERNRNPKCKHQRWVAIADQHVVGYGSFSQFAGDYHPQRFYVNFEVLLEYQRGGIGSALFDQVMEGMQKFQPRVLRADAFTNLPQGFAFLQKRGFYEAFRETPVHLEVSSCELDPYLGLEPKLNAQGIFIKTVRELEADPDRDRKIYELCSALEDDVPREEAQVEKPGLEEWIAWGLNDPSLLLDAHFFAIHGEDYIGLREIGRYTDQEALLGGLLGVRQDYRKRGIGLALQVRNIAYARENGYRLLKDCTAIQNAAMQKMFNRLGFQRDPEWLQCQKNLAQ
jgi:GNAT superfamily N-acetyltransferase